jgi:hypothetical protein
MAARMVGLMLRNYKRLALINTGAADIERYRDYARRAADRFGLRFEEIAGHRRSSRSSSMGPGTRSAWSCPWPTSRGDPISPLRWTTKSVRRLAAELEHGGHRVSYRMAGARASSDLRGIARNPHRRP